MGNDVEIPTDETALTRLRAQLLNDQNTPREASGDIEDDDDDVPGDQVELLEPVTKVFSPSKRAHPQE